MYEDLIKFNNVKVVDLQKNTLVLDKAFMNIISKKLIGKDVVIEFQRAENEKTRANQETQRANAEESKRRVVEAQSAIYKVCVN